MVDQDKTTVESQETEGAGAPKAPSPLKTYGLYGGIALVMIMAAYFVTLKVVKPMFSHKAVATQVAGDASGKETATKKETKEEPKKEGQETGKEKAEAPGHGKEGETGATNATGSTDNIYMIREIIVNPAGTGGTRFLSTSVGFQLENSKTSTLLAEQEAVVRDALITILSSQTIPELGDFRQREKLRQLIRQRVRKLLNTEDIASVYFTEFVLQ